MDVWKHSAGVFVLGCLAMCSLIDIPG